jgi:CheY-like chemotaxis protein
VVSNLLSNAVKFTGPTGSVRVLVARDTDAIEIDVIDSGQGIEPKFLPHLFEAFRQQDSSSTRRHGGLGLGLAIVKYLVELHHGSVTAHSDGANTGATMTVRFPLPAATTRVDPRKSQPPFIETGAKAIASNPPKLTGLRVLVCDDEPDARELVQSVLEAADAAVTPAASVQEAISSLDNGHFDVVVSDIGMPVRDGYGLIRYIRSRPTTNGGSVPAIALTAYASANDRARVLAAGYSAHARKPIEPNELVRMIARLAH